MWDAELHLRLYEPEKSLPFQYEALKYIQEIKNSARIYVHRIGFDPPPIKEESRLTGKIKDIKSYSKNETLVQIYLLKPLKTQLAVWNSWCKANRSLKRMILYSLPLQAMSWHNWQ